MGRRGKSVVLALVVFAVIGVLAKPYLFPNEKTFIATSNPIEAYQQALDKGKPIFLEFHATW